MPAHLTERIDLEPVVLDEGEVCEEAVECQVRRCQTFGRLLICETLRFRNGTAREETRISDECGPFVRSPGDVWQIGPVPRPPASET